MSEFQGNQGHEGKIIISGLHKSGNFAIVKNVAVNQRIFFERSQCHECSE